ncbi:filamentous hemagglutinin N-terminal domain-containing protein [Microseira sp. BLCC-F43]|jgi:filamentous hemagglutinin family protein|uniref:two-partner secretion domain-containing protein n=1 Tax=Microseira sp. BLCC-F43 TaxID=3153602 RepID=UPI0035B90622
MPLQIKSFSKEFWLASNVALLCLAIATPTQAQIIPDTTLPVNSTITPQGNTLTIEGGTTAGSNLFHSFREFSVPTGAEAFFNNAADIQNILTRVTGGNLSNIDGLIRANGTANLFLLNPNGIIFGSNARLRIGGSFLATTATGFVFPNNYQFSATNPKDPPLLTINVPIGLQFGSNPGRIEVRDAILRVPTLTSLALIGGNIVIDNATLSAPESRIELGSVASAGQVDINSIAPLRLSFPTSVTRGDILLNNEAFLNATSILGGASIAINTRNLEMRQASGLFTGVEGFGPPERTRGNIDINATGVVLLTQGSDIRNNTRGVNGNSGNINISAQSLLLSNNAVLSASKIAEGNAGKIAIALDDTLSLENNNGIVSSVASQGVGNSGDIEITTRVLSISGGSTISSLTRGNGNAGNIRIAIRDTFTADGIRTEGSSGLGLPTRIESGVAEDAQGNGGKIEINTGDLIVSNGDQISASTFGNGDAGLIRIVARDTIVLDGIGQDNFGVIFSTTEPDEEDTQLKGIGGNIEINTGSLTLRNGATLSTSTFGQGDAGDIIIRSSDRVSIDGAIRFGIDADLFSTSVGTRVSSRAIGNGGDIDITAASLSVTNGTELTASTFGEANAGTIRINLRDSAIFDGSFETKPSQASSRVEFGAVGDARGIEITAPSLSLTNGDRLSVTAEGFGNAGNINIDADAVSLDNNTSLCADTVGNEGNINLRSNSLILHRNSTITTNARGSNNIGGNIIIDSDAIAALENSDITANSTDFRGGTVTIDTQGIFGTQFRQEETSISDITATGANSELSGTVAINTPDIDPSAGLIALPENVVDITGIVDQQCSRQARRSSFVVTGRGGIPPSPDEPLSPDAFLVDLVTINTEGRSDAGTRGRGEEENLGSNTEQLPRTQLLRRL